ncbi:MAG: flagellar assembly protein FliH [Azospira oryzae]|nr:MAG: flagellar assembly protein FliH [Azospira oryzae]PZP75331.1 MAG: flagellar assembly protein FliH [Azospira oryzae]
MSGIIPKERLSAFQRWELGHFNETRTEDPPVKLPTAEELERLHQSARDEGYAAGYAEGRNDVRAHAERLKALGDAWAGALARFDEEVAEALTRLALDIASQVVRAALTVRPELVTAVVKEAIASLPHPGGHPRLLLHPDDAALVRAHLGNELDHGGWKVVEDPAIERGGCRVESAATSVDATLATRWERVAAALQDEKVWSR